MYNISSVFIYFIMPTAEQRYDVRVQRIRVLEGLRHPCSFPLTKIMLHASHFQ